MPTRTCDSCSAGTDASSCMLAGSTTVNSAVPGRHDVARVHLALRDDAGERRLHAAPCRAASATFASCARASASCACAATQRVARALEVALGDRAGLLERLGARDSSRCGDVVRCSAPSSPPSAPRVPGRAARASSSCASALPRRDALARPRRTSAAPSRSSRRGSSPALRRERAGDRRARRGSAPRARPSRSPGRRASSRPSPVRRSASPLLARRRRAGRVAASDEAPRPRACARAIVDVIVVHCEKLPDCPAPRGSGGGRCCAAAAAVVAAAVAAGAAAAAAPRAAPRRRAPAVLSGRSRSSATRARATARSRADCAWFAARLLEQEARLREVGLRGDSFAIADLVDASTRAAPAAPCRGSPRTPPRPAASWLSATRVSSAASSRDLLEPRARLVEVRPRHLDLARSRARR